MENIKFSITKRLKSFKFAINGLRILIMEEHNSRIHLFAMLLAIILGFVFKIETYEWIGILLSIGLVISMELLNSALENLADFATKEKHDLIKKTKDLAAAAVLWSSLIALSIGILIFSPKFIDLL